MYRIIFCTFLLFSLINSNKLPSYLTKCKVSDSECLTKSGNDAIKNLGKNGDKDFQLGPINSIKFDKLILQASKSLSIDMFDVEITGLENAVFEEIKFDKNILEVKGHADHAESISKYNISGQILVLPIRGNGIINITFVNVRNFIYKANIKTADTKGFTKYYIESESLKFEPERIYWDLTNLFDGDKRLGDEMNKFLNDNWKEVFEEVQEAIFNVFAKIFHKYVNGYFGKISTVDLIDD